MEKINNNKIEIKLFQDKYTQKKNTLKIYLFKQIYLLYLPKYIRTYTNIILANYSRYRYLDYLVEIKIKCARY